MRFFENGVTRSHGGKDDASTGDGDGVTHASRDSSAPHHSSSKPCPSPSSELTEPSNRFKPFTEPSPRIKPREPTSTQQLKPPIPMVMAMERTPHAAHFSSTYTHACAALRYVALSSLLHTTWTFSPCHPRHQKKKVQQSGVGGSGGASHRGVTLRLYLCILREEKEGDPHARYPPPIHRQVGCYLVSPGHIFRAVPSSTYHISKPKATCSHLSVSLSAWRGAGLVRRGHPQVVAGLALAAAAAARGPQPAGRGTVDWVHMWYVRYGYVGHSIMWWRGIVRLLDGL